MIVAVCFKLQQPQSESKPSQPRLHIIGGKGVGTVHTETALCTQSCPHSPASLHMPTAYSYHSHYQLHIKMAVEVTFKTRACAGWLLAGGKNGVHQEQGAKVREHTNTHAASPQNSVKTSAPSHSKQACTQGQNAAVPGD